MASRRFRGPGWRDPVACLPTVRTNLDLLDQARPLPFVHRARSFRGNRPGASTLAPHTGGWRSRNPRCHMIWIKTRTGAFC